MKKLLFLCLVALTITSCECSTTDSQVPDAEAQVRRVCEYAYFEGQKDAINGNVRIELQSDGVYRWTKSPWDSGTQPIFIPTLEHSKIEY